MTELPALPLVPTSSSSYCSGLASDAHDLPLTENASAQQSNSAYGSDRIAGVSSSASAPVPRASAASSSNLRPTSGIGIVNADDWVYGIVDQQTESLMRKEYVVRYGQAVPEQ